MTASASTPTTGDLKEYDYWFVYSCYALAWAVEQHDTRAGQTGGGMAADRADQRADGLGRALR